MLDSAAECRLDTSFETLVGTEFSLCIEFTESHLITSVVQDDPSCHISILLQGLTALIRGH